MLYCHLVVNVGRVVQVFISHFFFFLPLQFLAFKSSSRGFGWWVVAVIQKLTRAVKYNKVERCDDVEP